MRILPLAAQSFENGEAVDFRQHEVQHDHVILVFRCKPETFAPVLRNVDGVAFPAETFLQGRAETRGVLDEQ